MDEAGFMRLVDPQRDPAIWKREADGVWHASDSVANHRNDPLVDKARVPLRANATAEFPAGRYDLSDPRWLMEYEAYKLL